MSQRDLSDHLNLTYFMCLDVALSLDVMPSLIMLLLSGILFLSQSDSPRLLHFKLPWRLTFLRKPSLLVSVQSAPSIQSLTDFWRIINLVIIIIYLYFHLHWKSIYSHRRFLFFSFFLSSFNARPPTDYSHISSPLVSSLHWVGGIYAYGTSLICSDEGMKPTLNSKCKCKCNIA